MTQFTAGPLTLRQRLEQQRAVLETERSSFLTHWRDLGDFIKPRRGRFALTDTNKGDRRSKQIIDSTATFAARTLSSGMHAGLTSPARPWFRLTTPDPDLAEYDPVKMWLHTVTQRMYTVFLKSNLYKTLPQLYGDLGVFGTSPLLILEDDQKVIRTQIMPVGSYCLGNDAKNQVRVFMREFRLTVRQLVERFGKIENGKPDWSVFSTFVRDAWTRGDYEQWIDVIHAIVPNSEYDPTKLHARFKPFYACYYEKSTDQRDQPAEDRFLERAGFDEFPVLAARWELTGEDVYGTDCPGMTALGDIRQLQLHEKRAMQAVEKQVNPPMVGPSALRATRASILPGEITYLDTPTEKGGFRPAHEVHLDIGQLEMKTEQIRFRVRRAFYEDLFLMLAYSDQTRRGAQPVTAREIDERHEEKLLALGPTLEQFNEDVADPTIDRTFNIMERRGMIPTPPPELEGTPLKVEYLSIMAQAQKMVALGGLERFSLFTKELAETDPSVLDKVNRDELIDEYAIAVGVPPRIINSEEQVAEVRQARAQAAQAAQQAEMLKATAPAAKALSETKTNQPSLLQDLMGQGQQGGPGEVPV
jgi:hypothetical protein